MPANPLKPTKNKSEAVLMRPPRPILHGLPSKLSSTSSFTKSVSGLIHVTVVNMGVCCKVCCPLQTKLHSSAKHWVLLNRQSSPTLGSPKTLKLCRRQIHQRPANSFLTE
ncbi:hypothetical protein POPTR_007G031650v4 [Populus trichocarpa]|uniref:Uncharacterized protein n=1 Tax=Populus trichocarpa TaxID=3694 RepID=A0ACC0SP66_POPTR|nr:hypothetical protein BDE02_07G029200 [Populus trichocarpa]KAI9391016.1 hypothetical protein POPTR_007G031650v4 [Populus trichocarpa]